MQNVLDWHEPAGIVRRRLALQRTRLAVLDKFHMRSGRLSADMAFPVSSFSNLPFPNQMPAAHYSSGNGLLCGFCALSWLVLIAGHEGAQKSQNQTIIKSLFLC